MRKPHVLMLGWEFPPNVSGGLGVASYHIIKALKEHADITLILPYVSARIRFPGVNIISIGNLPVKKIFSKKELKILFSKYMKKSFRFELSPYPVKKTEKTLVHRSSKTARTKSATITYKNPLADADLYGQDVMEKVQLFAEFASRLSKNYSFDVIHAHDWMTFPAGLAIKEISGKPLVLHVHSLNTDRLEPGNQGWIYNLEKNALEKADLLIPVSKYTGNMIAEHYGINSKKIFPVYNGVQHIETYKGVKKFPEKLVLFLGRLTYQKGPEYFLEIAAEVIRNYQNVRFVVAGDGDKFRHIVEQSAYKDIGNKLHFTGYINREKVNELLSLTDVFVMPSVSEPFGLVALEAAQFGIPMVISKHSGASEVLKGALKADFWDIELMVNYILKLLTDDNLRNKIVRQNIKDLGKLTWENNALKIKEAYRKLNIL
jgi:glycogen synthase